MKKLHILYITGAFLCIVPQTIRAEGEVPRTYGVYGVNRRIITRPSTAQPYTGVAGTFTVPTIFVPGQVYWAPSPGATPDVIEGRANSKPTFYLGGRIDLGEDAGNFEVDAGVQYEWQAFTAGRPDPNDPTQRITDYIPPGFGIFVRTSNAQWSTPNTWRQPYGYRFGPFTLNPGVTSVEMELLFERTGVPLVGYRSHLETNLVGAAMQPNGNGMIEANDGNRVRLTLDGMQMKRVVGITQGGGGYLPLAFPLDVNAADRYYEEDGSYMHDIRFSEGRIAINPNIPSPVWQRWDVAAQNDAIDQEDTGSIPGHLVEDQTQRAPAAVRGMHLPSATPIFTYRSLDDTNQPPNSEISSRYRDETMSISLRRAVQVIGDVVSIGEAGPGTSG